MKLPLLFLLVVCTAIEVANAENELNDEIDVSVPEWAYGSNHTEVGLTAHGSFNDLEITKRALEAMQSFVEIFNSDIFSKVGVKQVAEMISKIFSCVISIINLIQGVTGPQESEEIKFMREQFEEVHRRLDMISLQLDDVKRLIEWQTTRVMFSQYEESIISLSRVFDDYFAARTVDMREYHKRIFMAAFKSRALAPLELYNAIVEIDRDISTNLAMAVTQYTQNHRRNVMNFLLAMQRRIMRGAQLEIAYEKMKHGDSAAAMAKTVWDARMEKLLNRMHSIEVGIKNSYATQMNTDVIRTLLEQRHVSNGAFGYLMYNFLADKFDWRHWFVLVHYQDCHAISYCGGVAFQWTHGNRFIVVASTDPKTTLFTRARADAALEAAQREYPGSHSDWARVIRSKIGLGCHQAAFVGTMCHGPSADINMKAKDDTRFVYRTLGSAAFLHILFG